MKKIALVVAIALSTSMFGSFSVQASDMNLKQGTENNINVNDSDKKDDSIKDKQDETSQENKETTSNVDDISQNKSDEDKKVNENSNYDKLETDSNKGVMLFATNIENVDIISQTLVTKEIAKEWAKKKGATEEFINLADLYWKYASERGNVNPAIAYAQSAKETAYGHFGGVIDASYHNPCGLKTTQGGADDDQNAHYRFNNWDEGVQAHLDHLALYAGATGYPRKDTFDPRHFESIFGKAKTVKDLGGAWAPSESYGLEVLSLYNEMLSNVQVKNGWIQEDDKWYYYENNNKVTGLKTIDGYKYYFNSDGVRQSGVITEGNIKYFLAEDGKLTSYFKEENGVITAYNSDDTVKTGLNDIDGKTYYFNDNGVMQKRWVNIKDVWYFFGEDGTMVKGWKTLDDHKYYFDDNGAMATGIKEINNKKYCFDGSGVMKTSWVTIDGKKYYFDKDGIMQVGWITLDGSKYYLNDDGMMQTYWKQIDGKWYYLGDNGIMQTRWVMLDGNWYFFNENGEMASGWTILDNNKYYFDASGVMASGKQEIDGDKYYFDASGVMQTSWIDVDGKRYYHDEDGKMQTGWITLDGKRYYLNDDGTMQTHWSQMDGKWYYFDDKNGDMTTWWKQLDGNWYFFHSDGEMHSGWLDLGGNKYFIDASGVMQTGWQKIGGNEYYFYPNSGIMARDTIIDGKQIDSEGVAIEIAKKLIVVDPGHNYGGDYGAESTIDGVTYSETELDMYVAMKVKDELEKEGYNVVLTRQPFERPKDSLNESISKRVDLANNLNADAFISIHHDSSSTVMARGATTFYSSWKSGLDNTDIVPGKDPNGYDWYDLKVDLTPTKEAIKGKDLSKVIVDNLSSDVNYSNRKEHDRNLGVVKRTNMPAVLVECGFITNPEEAKKAADPNNQQKIGKAIAESVKEVIK